MSYDNYNNGRGGSNGAYPPADNYDRHGGSAPYPRNDGPPRSQDYGRPPYRSGPETYPPYDARDSRAPYDSRNDRPSYDSRPPHDPRGPYPPRESRSPYNARDSRGPYEPRDAPRGGYDPRDAPRPSAPYDSRGPYEPRDGPAPDRYDAPRGAPYDSNRYGGEPRGAPYGAPPPRYGGGAGGFDSRPPMGGGDRFGELGANLGKVDWQSVSLEKFEKNFYIEHPDVSAMTKEEAERIRKENDILVKGRAPNPIRTFIEGGFPDYLIEEIKKIGFERPTPIQVQGWPIALSGHDMIGIAETGSGKTCAFLLPAILHIMAQPEMKRGDGPIMLCLAPTRELAVQIEEECKRFGRCCSLKSICLFGGAGTKFSQKRALQNDTFEIVVATPGRLMDHLNEGTLNLHRVTYLVLDEADRMLDMGFEPQIRKIVSQIRPDRQTLMWSATWPKEVQSLARDLCKEDPVEIRVGTSQGLKACDRIEQRIVMLRSSAPQEKDRMLEDVLRSVSREKKEFKAIIFADKKRDCDSLCRVLRGMGFYAMALHGDKTQQERESTLQQFKTSALNILIATDVASRGLHVDDISHVINRDMPKDIETYVHRIGRTARAGNSGVAISLFTPEDGRHARELVRILRGANQQVPPELEDMTGGGPRRGGYSSGPVGYGGNNARGGYDSYSAPAPAPAGGYAERDREDRYDSAPAPSSHGYSHAPPVQDAPAPAAPAVNTHSTSSYDAPVPELKNEHSAPTPATTTSPVESQSAMGGFGDALTTDGGFGGDSGFGDGF